MLKKLTVPPIEAHPYTAHKIFWRRCQAIETLRYEVSLAEKAKVNHCFDPVNLAK